MYKLIGISFLIMTVFLQACGSSGDSPGTTISEGSTRITVAVNTDSESVVEFSDPYRDFNFTATFPQNSLSEELILNIVFYEDMADLCSLCGSGTFTGFDLSSNGDFTILDTVSIEINTSESLPTSKNFYRIGKEEHAADFYLSSNVSECEIVSPFHGEFNIGSNSIFNDNTGGYVFKVNGCKD